jgi:phospholipid N-methyltransferase
MLFARNFIKHPKMLGSVIPSSRYLIRQMLSRVDWQRARLIVEYGPGVGSFTTEILARMHPDARLVVFETNDEFVQFLRASIKDPRLTVVHDSAAEVGAVLQRLGHEWADYVLSGIPFSTMPEELRLSILDATQNALRPEGLFLVYQFSGSVHADLKRVFASVESGFEALNVPPARLWWCKPKVQLEAASRRSAAGA